MVCVPRELTGGVCTQGANWLLCGILVSFCQVVLPVRHACTSQEVS